MEPYIQEKVAELAQEALPVERAAGLGNVCYARDQWRRKLSRQLGVAAGVGVAFGVFNGVIPPESVGTFLKGMMLMGGCLAVGWTMEEAFNLARVQGTQDRLEELTRDGVGVEDVLNWPLKGVSEERVMRVEYLANRYAVSLYPSPRIRARRALGYLGRLACVGALGAAVATGAWWGTMKWTQGSIKRHPALEEFLPRIETIEK